MVKKTVKKNTKLPAKMVRECTQSKDNYRTENIHDTSDSPVETAY